MTVAIRTEGLSKQYLIHHEGGARHDTLRDALSSWARNLGARGRQEASSEEAFWALKDVNLEIREGERVGIIGRNGAGKSTLLKLLSRVTEPSAGRIRVRGRVASLLEAGTGFHPELTGRENIHLNGAVLGMSRAELARKLDEIVAFSEIEKFLDTPVKRYSSGMYVRLAFAVAAHLEPEILVVDEVLAVGDLRFQQKCLGKMEDAGREGRTILLVSHSLRAIYSLCTRAVLIADGRVKSDGAVQPVVAEYLEQGAGDVRERAWPELASAPGNEQFRLKRARVIPEHGAASDEITVKTALRIEFEFWVGMDEMLYSMGLHLRANTGEYAFVSASTRTVVKRGWHRGVCHIPADLLNNRTYTVEMYFTRDGRNVLARLGDLLVFTVTEGERAPGDILGDYPGTVRPRLQWELLPAAAEAEKVGAAHA
jgi:lipopolysaccharide transport system ATP-binding protein